ncbi:hypothetical protein BGZ57DRAFT_991891 [Hyaloscypha finlandica]|nr:hypothetical protein BGZ57DRAFT_991891 [Hyaloscypha finlandica]
MFEADLFGRKVSHIRLIDIDRKRLVWRTTSEAYTALSYMWGPPSLPQVRLTRSTQAGLFLDGALAEDNNMIPRTIRDAMLVYSPDFNAHLRMMNDIYASAYLTLAAAAGEDSWAGLPGVLPNSRKIHQTSIAIDGWDIGLATPHFLSSVIRSPWANRGWTFQERLFSERMLIFGEHQCFFYCDKAIRIETTITEVDEECHEKSHYFPTANYWDVLRAFGGVIATFEENMSSQFFFGLPFSMFTWALLLDYTQFSRRASFPSWSWAGWSADREDYLYPYKSVVLNRSWTLTVFYRLHPTLNKVHGQGNWILEKIEEVDTRGAAAYRDMDSVLYNQHLPDHLDRKDLEKLFVFDTPASKLEVSALKFKSTRPHTEWAADKGYDMMFPPCELGLGIYTVGRTTYHIFRGNYLTETQLTTHHLFGWISF